MNDEFINEMTRLVSEGYIKEDGTPLKCQKCESKNLKTGRKWYMDGWILEEYEVLCSNCNSVVAYWSYGNWQI